MEVIGRKKEGLTIRRERGGRQGDEREENEKTNGDTHGVLLLTSSFRDEVG